MKERLWLVWFNNGRHETFWATTVFKEIGGFLKIENKERVYYININKILYFTKKVDNKKVI